MKPDPVVIAARFQQQNPIARIRRKTIGQNTARRPSPDNHIIKMVAIKNGLVCHEFGSNSSVMPYFSIKSGKFKVSKEQFSKKIQIGR